MRGALRTPPEGPPGTGRYATYWLASGLYLENNVAEARALLHDGLRQVREGLDVRPDFTVRLLTALAALDVWDGEHQRALAYLEEGRTLLGNLDDRRRAAYLLSLALSYRETGDLEGAMRRASQSLGVFPGGRGGL